MRPSLLLLSIICAVLTGVAVGRASAGGTGATSAATAPAQYSSGSLVPAAADASGKALAVKSETGTTSTSSTSKLDPEQALLRLTRCLREEGLDVPDPKVDASGNLQLFTGERPRFDPDSAVAKNAIKVCQKYIQGIIQSFSADDLADIRDATVAYAQCLRKEGYDVPDPNFLSREGPFPTIDRNDKRFIEADKVCQPKLQRIQEVLSR
jgi:hypothetical protein